MKDKTHALEFLFTKLHYNKEYHVIEPRDIILPKICTSYWNLPVFLKIVAKLFGNAVFFPKFAAKDFLAPPKFEDT